MHKHKADFKKQIIALMIMMLSGMNLLWAQNSEYRIEDIPEPLRKNAYSVVRYKNQVYERKTMERSTIEVTEVISILNENDLDMADFKEYYDEFRKVKGIRVVIYDAQGKVVKKMKYDDIDDVSGSGSSLYNDTRLKVISADYQDIPFTVEFNYKVNFIGSMFSPPWIAVPGYHTSVEKSVFTVITPDNLMMNYRFQHIQPDTLIDEHKDGLTTISWQVTNIPAMEDHGFSLPFLNICPAVFMQAMSFSIDKYQGTALSWQTLGKMIEELNEGRGELPPATVAKIRALVNDTMTEATKVRILYEWMQDRTRYASIQVGIGGWQPTSADEVDDGGYGDCKALVNYTQSILAAAGIKSYYTLINGGASAELTHPDFPDYRFNHAILCVPQALDTLWLECTSQQDPCGYLGTFTDNRYALVINEEGGTLVKTKAYPAMENIKLTKATVDLTDNMRTMADVNVSYSGQYYEAASRLLYADLKTQKEMLVDDIEIPSFELVNYTIEESRAGEPEITVDMDVELRSFATGIGKRLMFDINPFNKILYGFDRISTRKSDIFFRRGYTGIDTVIFVLPMGYSIERVPAEVNLENEFGTYSSRSVTADGRLTYIRKVTINEGTYSGDQYPDLKAFLTEVKKAEKQKVVLVGM